MKKILFSFLMCVVCCCLTAKDYSFTVLGDIHFDGAVYHTSKPANASRKKERERNLAMWRDGLSAQVLSAAARQTVPEMPFVIQLGDFTQGDCDTELLQEKMFKDGFAEVKKFFPNHKLLAVKGNHDVRVIGVKGYCNGPSEKAFMPLIAKELGRSNVSGGYTVKQGPDLFVFFDGFWGDPAAVESVRKLLAEQPDSRYTFFITHLPVLPCSESNPVWLLPAYRPITKMLAKRNAIILTAHTHVPSFTSVKTKHGELSQIVVSSMGNQWQPNGKPRVTRKNFQEYRKNLKKSITDRPIAQTILNEFEAYQIHEFEIYSAESGFAVIKVNDNGVTAEFYADASGKPWQVKTMRQNSR